MLAAIPATRSRTLAGGAPYDPLPEWIGPSTRAVHAGRRPERNAGALVTPIYQTSTFQFPAAFSDASDPRDVRIYTRYENPTQEAAAEVLRALEGAGAARVFSSGMAAITSTLLTFLRSGDRIAAPEELYGGTHDFLTEVAPRWGIEVQWIAPGVRDPSEVLRRPTRLVYLETPTNPLLQVHDLARWARAADAVGALLVVDNTFATPINQRPLDWGADLVLHSASKYLGGHSDLIAGALAGPPSLVDRVGAMHRLLGGSLDPFAAFLLHRGLKTLPIRVARQNENGRRVAEALSTHPGALRVHYPGLGDSEAEAIAARQMSGRGGMVSVVVNGGAAGAERFLKRLRLVHVAASLGGVDSLASRPPETSHAHLDPTARSRLGIEDGLVRISLGIEEPEDLIRDLSEALDGI